MKTINDKRKKWEFWEKSENHENFDFQIFSVETLSIAECVYSSSFKGLFKITWVSISRSTIRFDYHSKIFMEQDVYFSHTQSLLFVQNKKSWHEIGHNSSK